MKSKTAEMTKRCPYCMSDERVDNISVRTIEGYRNPLTGKNSAIVEHLSCGHEFVDNKFNVDALYFRNPEIKQPEQKQVSSVVNSPTPVQYIPYKQSGGVNFLDVCVLVCMVCLAVTVPPLVVLPVLYFYGRLSGK